MARSIFTDPANGGHCFRAVSPRFPPHTEGQQLHVAKIFVHPPHPSDTESIPRR